MSAPDDQIRDFWTGRTAVTGHTASRFHSEHDRYDLAPIAALCGPGARVLDLGCGTCSVANALVEHVGCSVHAVDYVEGFLRHAIDDPRLTVEAADVRSYRRDERFDLVLLLGVITSIEPAEERAAVYANCAAMLPAGAPLFVKAQFGIDEPVLVDAWSEALGAQYRALYPLLDDELELMAEHFTLEVRDPYPPELNPHPNTHFHHVVARRR
jgi:hypothetical protein